MFKPLMRLLGKIPVDERMYQVEYHDKPGKIYYKKDKNGERPIKEELYYDKPGIPIGTKIGYSTEINHITGKQLITRHEKDGKITRYLREMNPVTGEEMIDTIEKNGEFKKYYNKLHPITKEQMIHIFRKYGNISYDRKYTKHDWYYNKPVDKNLYEVSYYDELGKNGERLIKHEIKNGIMEEISRRMCFGNNGNTRNIVGRTFSDPENDRFNRIDYNYDGKKSRLFLNGDNGQLYMGWDEKGKITYTIRVNSERKLTKFLWRGKNRTDDVRCFPFSEIKRTNEDYELKDVVKKPGNHKGDFVYVVRGGHFTRSKKRLFDDSLKNTKNPDEITCVSLIGALGKSYNSSIVGADGYIIYADEKSILRIYDNFDASPFKDYYYDIDNTGSHTESMKNYKSNYQKQSKVKDAINANHWNESHIQGNPESILAGIVKYRDLVNFKGSRKFNDFDEGHMNIVQPALDANMDLPIVNIFTLIGMDLHFTTTMEEYVG